MNLEDYGIKRTKNYAEILEEDAISQIREVMSLDCNVQAALMPDAHSGYVLPIGGVVKSKEMIFPAYIGYDIGCGVSALKLNISKDSVSKAELEKIKEVIVDKIGLGTQREVSSSEIKKSKEIVQPLLEKLYFKDLNNKDVIAQLGTLGGGNHFIEIGYGEDNSIWIVIHSGSRNFGHSIAKNYMKVAAVVNTEEERYEKEFEEKNNHWKDKNPEGFEKAKKEFVYRRVRARLKTNIEGNFGIPLYSKEGQEYLNDMNLGLEFALENRKKMIYKIMGFFKEVLGRTDIKDEFFVNKNHNHGEVVEENGVSYVIHRKGATQADEGMYGVIPGNMRDGSFIVRGKGNKDSLNSSSHGAGRVLSRRMAKEILTLKELEEDMEGIVCNISEATIDESPEAYKNIFEVMEAQKDLVEIVDYIKPLINIKG